MEKIHVFIVDDHEVVRLGLRGLFARYQELVVVGESATGEDAVHVVPKAKPDVVLMDIRLPGISGIDTCRLIRTAMPGVQVVFLSSFAEPEEVQAAFNAGGIGYVLKNITSNHVIAAIKSAMRGQAYIDPDVTEQAMNLIRGSGRILSESYLTRREEEIILLVSEGKTNGEIGKLLFLSEKTVRNHVSRILAKLGLSNRSQATAYWVRQDKRKKSR